MTSKRTAKERIRELMRNKKALEVSILVVIILVIIIFIVIVIYTNNIMNLIQSDADREGCRASVIAASMTNPKVPFLMKGRGGHEIAKLDCPVKELTYDDTSIKAETGMQTEQLDKAVKKVITDQMYECYYKMNEGKSDFIPPYELGTGNVESLNYCVICSTIDVSSVDVGIPNNSPEGNPGVTGLIKYLREEKIKNPTQPMREMTYWEYLTGLAPADDDQGMDIVTSESDYIDTSKKLAVVFVLTKSHNIKDERSYQLLGGIAGGTAGFIGGSVVSSLGGKAIVQGVGALITRIPYVGPLLGGGVKIVGGQLPLIGLFIGGSAGYNAGTNEAKIYRTGSDTLQPGAETEAAGAVAPPNAGVLVVPFDYGALDTICHYLGALPTEDAFSRQSLYAGSYDKKDEEYFLTGKKVADALKEADAIKTPAPAPVIPLSGGSS